jgi:hypothetical protein
MRWAHGIRKLGRCEVQTQPVGSRLKVDKRFKVRVVHGPLLGRETILVVCDRQLPIERLRNVCTLAEDQEDLLMDLRRLSVCEFVRNECFRIPKIRRTRKEHEAQVVK